MFDKFGRKLPKLDTRPAALARLKALVEANKVRAK